jgi:hypothetical protein
VSADPHQLQAVGRESPIQKMYSVTPSDTVNLTRVSSVIFVTGNEGTVTVVERDDSEFTIPAVMLPKGVGLAYEVKRIKSTGTSATGIIVGCH